MYNCLKLYGAWSVKDLTSAENVVSKIYFVPNFWFLPRSRWLNGSCESIVETFKITSPLPLSAVGDFDCKMIKKFPLNEIKCGEMGMHFVSLRLQPLTRVVYFGTCMTCVSCWSFIDQSPLSSVANAHFHWAVVWLETESGNFQFSIFNRFMQACTSTIFLLSAACDIELLVCPTPGTTLQCADALSRSHI